MSRATQRQRATCTETGQAPATDHTHNLAFFARDTRDTRDTLCCKACSVPGVSRASALPGTKFVRQAAKTYGQPAPWRVLPTGMPCGYVEARRRRRRETLPEGFRFTRPALLRVLPRGTPCGCVEARRRGRCETLPEGLYSHPPGRKAGKCTWSDRDRFRAGRVATFHPPTAARMTSACRRFPRRSIGGFPFRDQDEHGLHGLL